MKLFLAVGLLALVATSAMSVPLKQQLLLPKNSRTYGNFVPAVESSFETFKPQQRVIKASGSVDPVAAAVEFFRRKTNSVSQIQVSSSHTSEHNGVTHVYLQQIVNGLQVVNGVGNVNVGRNGEILSFGSSFFNGVLPEPTNVAQPHSPAEAIESVENLVGKHSVKSLTEETPATLKYINTGNKLVLAWDVLVETQDNMYNGIVCVESNNVLQLIDWVSDATYNVFPLGINDPTSGDRVVLINPSNGDASPEGWHNQGDKTFTNTIGNNVYAQENHDGGNDYLNNERPEGGASLNFDFPLDLTKDPKDYLDVATTNLFYWNNVVHDLFYTYGFDEEAGNFQEDNNGKGGKGGDAVIANAQDGSGTNNANFMTPPDGQKGKMRMYVWTETDPSRDGDLEGGIIFHEYLHGVSIRLTGGPSNVGCLPSGESGGMGEGYGDFFATITRVTENDNRDKVFVMGDYSSGRPEGIRQKPYSTDMTLNDWTYKDVKGQFGVHAKGEIWAVFLYDVFWNLVEKHGFDPDWFNNKKDAVKTEGTYKSIINGQELPRPKRQATLGGNVIFFRLVVDGMKLQPCTPNFVEARDAILEADQINNNGENLCELWTGFAKRGLGEGAKHGGIFLPATESFKVPAGLCQ
jgi:extracellular elastinolytic metalloproteinase